MYLAISGWWCNNHLENMSSSMGRIIAHIMENKQCSKPPTRYIYIYIYTHTIAMKVAILGLPHFQTHPLFSGHLRHPVQKPPFRFSAHDDGTLRCIGVTGLQDR